MAFDAAKPRYTLPLGGEEYELVGSFEMIEAVEYALKENILGVTMRAIEMPATDVAKVLRAVLATNGREMSEREINGVLWEMGVGTDEFTVLRLHLHAFFRICIARPSEREGAAKKMGELLGKWSPASPGETTSDSP